MPKKAKTHRASHATSRKQADRDYDKRRKATPKLAEAKRIRSSARWQKVRALQLSQHPLCEVCIRRGERRPAAQVHHVEPIATRPELAFDLANLKSVCIPCHARLEGQERRGGVV